MRWIWLAVVFFAVVGGVTFSQDVEIRQGPRAVDPREWRVGKLIDDVAFTDIQGQAGTLSDYRGKLLVVAITNASCPICKKFAPALNAIHAEYADKGVEFLLVNPMEHERAAICKAAVERYGFKARYVSDPEGKLASALKSNSTGDCFVLDGARTLRYRGAVSDQYGFGYSLDQPRVSYLRDALDALLAGRSIIVPATWAPGCELDLKGAEPTGEITWHNRVSRIIQHNCQSCHREGESGPFELMTYEQVRGNRSMIRRQVSRGLMPPWFANPAHGEFANDSRLSEEDREALLAWIENGTPEGSESDAPLPKTWFKGWQIGEPEVVLEIPRVMRVPAEGTVPYRYQRLTTDFGEDKWVRAMEIRPTAPQNVHHVLVFLRYPKDHPRAAEQPDDQGGMRGYFMGMVPGMGHIEFAPGMGKFIPKGARLDFQLHYTTNGVEAEDRTRIGLSFCEERPRVEVETRGVSNPFFSIPPGADNHEVKAVHTLERNRRLLSLMPHMHLRGKAYRFEAEFPDGEKRVLLDVPRFDFNWQLLYILREPIDLPKGTVIRATGWFDNSDKNPANPDPTKTVTFGEQTWEEMQIGYLNWYALD